MTDKYNTKISQLSGLIVQTMTEILGDSSLKQGEKFIIAQQLIAGITPATKQLDKLKKELESWAKENLEDDGSGKSQPTKYEGAEVLVKFSYPKPQLDSEKLSQELGRTYSELGAEYDESLFLKPATPRKSVVIQSTID